MDTLYGPINVPNLGIIQVPGRTNEERLAYGARLRTNVGVFIPNFPCYSSVNNEELDISIAIGTLDNYKCFSKIQFIRNALYDPDIGIYIYDLLSYLHAFDSYFDTIHDRYWSGSLSDLEQWIPIAQYIRNLPASQVNDLLVLLRAVRNRAHDYDINRRWVDDNLRIGANEILQIIPNLVTITGEGATFQNFINTPNLPAFELVEELDELIKRITAIYSKFANVPSRNRFLPQQTEELITIGPAISLRPGGYAINQYQTQGSWIQPRNIPTQSMNSIYRSIYDICQGQVIDHNRVVNAFNELGLPIPSNSTDQQLCTYMRNYLERLPKN